MNEIFNTNSNNPDYVCVGCRLIERGTDTNL